MPTDTIVIPEKCVLVFSNEEKVLSSDFLKRCGKVASITQAGPVGNFNVAIAASIAMYEYSKKYGVPQIINESKFIGEFRY